MLNRAVGTVERIEDWEGSEDIQELVVNINGQLRPALNYLSMSGSVKTGDQVLLNTTAQDLGLGTGGYDFVIANKNASTYSVSDSFPNINQLGHIIKGRYTPLQQAVLTLEEQSEYSEIWSKKLNGFPVLVGQLHSQIAPASAGLQLSGKIKIAYIMTDAAALPIAFSKLVAELKEKSMLQTTITCGQAYGGDYETVTLHSALLAAKYIAQCDAAIVCQGPGNTGTGTQYGFSGIEQASNLDIVKALVGTPVAIMRMSSADKRQRHFGVSHHTKTTLDLAYARCIVPVPVGTDENDIPPGHDIRYIEGAEAALEILREKEINVTTMGRNIDQDPLFFLAAAAAGLAI